MLNYLTFLKYNVVDQRKNGCLRGSFLSNAIKENQRNSWSNFLCENIAQEDYIIMLFRCLYFFVNIQLIT